MGGRRRDGRARPRWAAPALLLAGALLATACQPAPPAPPAPPSPAIRYPSFVPSAASTYRTAWLSHDGTDAYAVTATRTTTRVTAGRGNVGSDSRMLLWPRGPWPVADGETCATWTGRTGSLTQQGAALRIVQEGARVRALTVTQNVWVNPFAFNIHTWDTSRSGAPQQTLAQFDMRATFFADRPPLPWRLCARAQGATVEFKIWSGHEAEPVWGDPARGGRATVPPGFRAPGMFGWYAGHLGRGDHADLSALGLWSFEAPPRSLLRDLAIPPS